MRATTIMQGNILKTRQSTAGIRQSICPQNNSNECQNINWQQLRTALIAATEKYTTSVSDKENALSNIQFAPNRFFQLAKNQLLSKDAGLQRAQILLDELKKSSENSHALLIALMYSIFCPEGGMLYRLTHAGKSKDLAQLIADTILFPNCSKMNRENLMLVRIMPRNQLTNEMIFPKSYIEETLANFQDQNTDESDQYDKQKAIISILRKVKGQLCENANVKETFDSYLSEFSDKLNQRANSPICAPNV